MNHRSLLARATEGTDAPTPGYLYVDLAKIATGNPAACQDMSKYLSGRLASKNNSNIKFKCCKVIAKLCEQVPRNAFRRCVAQDHEAITAIKEAMNYRGAMDPVRGDEPNNRVRIAAKEALDAVYNEAPSSEMTGGAAGGYGNAGGIPSSYGSSPHAQGGGYSGGGAAAGPRRMEGIGNPRYQDPRNDPRYDPDNPTGIKGVVREAGEIISGMIKDPLARNIQAPPQVANRGHSGNLPGYGNPTYGRPPPGSSDVIRQTGGQWTMASNRGPGAVGGQEHNEQSSQWGPNGSGVRSGGVGGSWGSASVQQSYSTPSITVNTIPGASSGSGGAAVSDGAYERNLILELCPPGGLKPVPPPDKLANFERACPTLNSDLICPVLLDCLEEGQPWIIRAKALCVMETCIAAGTRMSDGINPYRDFFHACQDEIAPLVSHVRAPIRDPAKRVLQLLGVAFDAPAQSSTRAAPHAAHVDAPNLLDFMDDAGSEPSAPAMPNQPPPPPMEAPPPPPSTSSSGNMFGGMQLKSAPAQPPAPQPTPSLLDFDTPAVSSSDMTNNFTPVGVSETTSIFDQLSINSAAKTEVETAVKEISSGASAFGFINATTEEAHATPKTPGKEIFDPLKGGTPNSANQQKKSMHLSPQQIQAMAYQQMMMQQQYQQMQMAVAMQNQFHAPGMVPMHPVMPINAMGTNVGMMPMPQQQMNMNMRFQGAPSAASAGFSFIDAPKAPKMDDKKFDFVKDAMSSAGHKK